MIHLVLREPIDYQRTLCQALTNASDRGLVAWFSEGSHRLRPSEHFNAQFLPEVGYGRLSHALREDSEPVVILGGWSSAMAYKTLLIARLRRAPIFIWTDHPHPRERSWTFAILRSLYLGILSRLVAGFLACGQPTVEHLETLGIPRQKITNFPYWVDLPSEWSLPAGCSANADPPPLRLLAIGRQVPVKAFEVAIAAVSLANQRAGRVVAKLDLIGDGPQRPRLQTHAHSLPWEDAIKFWGWVPNGEVWQRLKGADALIVPSLFEPYGVVVLEALANGRPVLASDKVVAALDRDDGAGAIYFHPVGNATHLAGQIRLLAEDRNALRHAAEAARAIAEKWPPERAATILSGLGTTNLSDSAAKSNPSVSPSPEGMPVRDGVVQ
jgi:glycosyltransferase involved in cell wall biosynthesis